MQSSERTIDHLQKVVVTKKTINHLDIETIDSLAEALNEWDGGLVLVSHDFRLNDGNRPLVTDEVVEFQK